MADVVPDTDSFEFEQTTNDAKMETLVKAMFPDILVPYAEIYKILAFLEETQVNPQIVPTIIRGVHNISIGTGVGQVVVHVKEALVTVSVRENNDEVKTKV